MASTGRRHWKWTILATGLLALLALGFWYFKYRGNSGTQYQTAEVVRGDLTQFVTATGQLNPVTNVQVGSQISGIISHLYADWNSQVTNGQIVALIDPATYRANVQQAQADLANTKASLELAQVNARRARELYDGKLIPQSDYDTAVASLHQAEASVMNKQAALANAQVNLDRCTIDSPVDGIVISRNVDIGQTVAASLSAPVLFVIANDLTKMQIDANVAEADIGGVEEGQKVDFSVDAFPNRKFHGVVTQVRYNPITVQNVVTYDTVIGVSNPDLKLMPGMTANVSIILAERNNVLKIPNAALRFHPPESMTNAVSQRASGGSRSGGGPGGRRQGERRSTHTVYALKNDKLQPIQIKTGISDGSSTEVTEGLSESNTVVTAAYFKQATSSQQPANPFGGMRRF